MPSMTRWIVLGDIHGKTDGLRRIAELPLADGVLVTGDMTVGGDWVEAAQVLAALREENKPVLALIGNLDRKDVTDALRSEGLNLHAAARNLAPGVVVMGLGGSNPTPFGTPGEFSEQELRVFLDEGLVEARLLRRAPTDRLVLVSHCPPKDTACDLLAGGGHAGSLAVRDFIEETQPALCLCGHIHEAAGEDRIGRTRIVNPGAFQDGAYAILEIGDAALRVTLRRVPD